MGPSFDQRRHLRVATRFRLILALLLHGPDGSNQEGRRKATPPSATSCSSIFTRFLHAVPSRVSWTLVTDQATVGPPLTRAPTRRSSRAARTRTTTPSYAASVGDTSDSTAQIFGCGGTLSANPPLCAGLNRHVAQLPTARAVEPGQLLPGGPGELLRRSSGTPTRSTTCSTASRTTTTPGSPRTSRSPTRSTWWSRSAGRPAGERGGDWPPRSPPSCPRFLYTRFHFETVFAYRTRQEMTETSAGRKGLGAEIGRFLLEQPGRGNRA